MPFSPTLPMPMPSGRAQRDVLRAARYTRSMMLRKSASEARGRCRARRCARNAVLRMRSLPVRYGARY